LMHGVTMTISRTYKIKIKCYTGWIYVVSSSWTAQQNYKRCLE